MTAALLAAVGLPAITGTFLLLAGHRANRLAPALALTAAALTLVAAIACALAMPRLVVPFISSDGAALAVDGPGAILLPAVAAVVLLVLVFAAAEGTRPAARFHGLMLVFSAAVMVTVTATSLPALLGAWEIMGATSYALIGFHWHQPTTVPSGLVAFAVTRTADLGLYAAAGAAVAAGTGWQLDALASTDGLWLHVLAAGVLVAGLGKAAQLPFSFWLSRAMEGPSPVSALLHSAAMVAMGGYLLLRLNPLLLASGWAGPAAAWIGATTAIVLGIVALAQKDLKQLLAASTAAQLGFVVLAAGIGATAGGTSQLLAHAATKALLFLAAGAWLTAVGSKQLPALHGIGRRWPVLGASFLVGALSLAGLPPLSLWLAKDAILAVALQENPALYGAGLLGSALAAAYSAKMIAVIWARPDTQGHANMEEKLWDAEEHGTRKVPAAGTVPLVVLAASAALLGATALPGLSGPFRALLGAQAEAESSGWELVASAAIAIVVAVLVLVRGVPHLAAAGNWFGLERGAQAVFVRPMFASAALLSRLDRRLEMVVLGSGRLLDRSATASGEVDGSVQRALRAVLAGVNGLGRLARRAQTGAVADYYAATVLVCVAALVLLIVVR
ncbi:proton-conducting transporter membrane subunit [Arthrobacter sp.]|uniref:proton-conducting transporter transmembrane domain-containing protein n=1 Tax=Arthrobacter sp. TaxID=1667 RepID=UPI003A94D300